MSDDSLRPEDPSKPLEENDVFETHDPIEAAMDDELEGAEFIEDGEFSVEEFEDDGLEGAEFSEFAEDDLEGFDDEWSEEFDGELDDDSDDAFAASSAPSKGNKIGLLAGVGVVGLAAIAGGAYYFLMGPGAATQQVAQQKPVNQQEVAQQAVSPKKEENKDNTSLFNSLEDIPAPTVSSELVQKNKEQNFDPNADIFSALEGEKIASKPESNDPFDALPQPSPISTDTSEQSQTDEQWSDFSLPGSPSTPNNDVAPEVSQKQDEPQQDFVDFNALPGFSNTMETDGNKEEDTASVTKTLVPDTVQPETSQQVASATTQETKDLQNQIDQLTSRLDRFEEKLDRAAQAAPSGSTAEMKRIEKTLQRLESRIEDLAKAPKIAQAPVAKSTRTAKSSSTNIKKAAVRRQSKKRSLSRWALRGASPGQALVSAKGSDEIQTVRVGQKVAGLGTIQFIGVEAGKWVVKTSQGTIKQ